MIIFLNLVVVCLFFDFGRLFIYYYFCLTYLIFFIFEKKIAEETNTTVTEMEGTILIASINNQTMNAMNITQIAEDLRYLIQSNMDDRALQVQRMLADELD